MGKIRVLDEHLSNMIAAGEVVERPASVVKELVENAVDASATRIEIHIEEGGLDLIRVVDDGQGMDRDDCRTAFERHATSKINTTRDLFQIRTLGFRGEALPSIASVSRVELISSEASGQVGTRIVVEGGQMKTVEDIARVKGTEICVRELFFNTPARLKYMKSIATEIGHISDFVTRLALTYPSISFILTHNGKTLLQTSGDGKLLHVMGAIYGVQVAKLLLPISGETLDYKWEGFLSKTEVTRANRSYLTTLVNGRYIRNFALNNAIMRGYHTLLPIGRYPIVVLQIEMEPTLVDVNVHPAKLEARFSKEEELCQAIEKSVQTTLRQGLKIVRPFQAERGFKTARPQAEQPQFDFTLARSSYQGRETARIREWLPSAQSSLPSSAYSPSEQLERKPLSSIKESADLYSEEKKEPEELLENKGKALEEPKGQEAQDESGIPADQDRRSDAESYDLDLQQEHQGEPDLQVDINGLRGSDSGLGESPAEPSVPLFFPVAQVHGTYIVAQNETGMYLIDQHAAQERIFYEYFMQKLAEQSVSSQMLLFPHTVECTVAEAEKLFKKLPLLQSFGLEIESFGNRTFIVRAHPHWFPADSELELIEELIQFVLETGENEQADMMKMREKAAILMSCKASIKANRYLTQSEMESLLVRLRETSSPFTCPHGRPIVIHFSTYELQKMFKR